MRAWDPEEDTIIMEMVNTGRAKWKQIVKRLPGDGVAGRMSYQRIEKGRKLREDPNVTLKNRCHLCGLPKRGHICMAKMGGARRSPSIEVAGHYGGAAGGRPHGAGGPRRRSRCRCPTSRSAAQSPPPAAVPPPPPA